MGDAKPSSQGASADACPVDHKSREAWLAQAREAAASAGAANPPPPPTPHAPPQRQQQAPRSWSQSIYSYLPFTSPASTTAAPRNPTPPSGNLLDTEREVSSIPRSSEPGPSACPSNSEAETGRDEKSGNWVYPSEKMFFDAMRRKGLGAEATDMKTVVPIHNAVNERAWKEILEWEKPYIEGTPCDGPKLHSFEGLSKNMSPKARINTILGYTAPFDRHDWVVDRCGTRVEYIIDFYAGRSKGTPGAGGPSFYLDVRPKLNSWEGVKMRALRGLGMA